MNIKFLNIDDVCALLQISRRTLERRRKEGKFPEPTVHIGKYPRWTLESISKGLENKKD